MCAVCYVMCAVCCVLTVSPIRASSAAAALRKRCRGTPRWRGAKRPRRCREWQGQRAHDRDQDSDQDGAAHPRIRVLRGGPGPPVRQRRHAFWGTVSHGHRRNANLTRAVCVCVPTRAVYHMSYAVVMLAGMHGCSNQAGCQLTRRRCAQLASAGTRSRGRGAGR